MCSAEDEFNEEDDQPDEDLYDEYIPDEDEGKDGLPGIANVDPQTKSLAELLMGMMRGGGAGAVDGGGVGSVGPTSVEEQLNLTLQRMAMGGGAGGGFGSGSQPSATPAENWQAGNGYSSPQSDVSRQWSQQQPSASASGNLWGGSGVLPFSQLGQAGSGSGESSDGGWGSGLTGGGGRNSQYPSNRSEKGVSGGGGGKKQVQHHRSQEESAEGGLGSIQHPLHQISSLSSSSGGSREQGVGGASHQKQTSKAFPSNTSSGGGGGGGNSGGSKLRPPQTPYVPSSSPHHPSSTPKPLNAMDSPGLPAISALPTEEDPPLGPTATVTSSRAPKILVGGLFSRSTGIAKSPVKAATLSSGAGGTVPMPASSSLSPSPPLDVQNAVPPPPMISSVDASGGSSLGLEGSLEKESLVETEKEVSSSHYHANCPTLPHTLHPTNTNYPYNPHACSSLPPLPCRSSRTRAKGTKRSFWRSPNSRRKVLRI